MTPPKSPLVSQLTQVAQRHATRLGAALKLRPKARVPRLEVRAGDGQPTQLYDLVGDRYLIGRNSSKCDIVVQTPLVSQVHAQILRDRTRAGAPFVIKDENSTNGIYRHKQRLRSAPLRHNVTIALGPPELEQAATLRYLDPPPWYVRAVRYAALGAGSLAALLGLAIAIEWQKFEVKPLPITTQGPVEVLARDGQTSIGPPEREKHTELATLAEFGQYVPKAVIASEDSSYYWHLGVDPVGILRAVATNVRSGELREGGSTITQQLARNLLGETYVGTSDSLGRKWREAVAAIKLTFNYSKNDLLAIYLNRVYLGNGVYGFNDAARLYFGKEASALDLSEAATLAGILPAPNYINPFKNKDLAIAYRDRVLRRLVELGMASEAEAERARRSILRLNEAARTKLQGTVAPYFYGYVFDEMREVLGERFAREGNLIVETNLDPALQQASDAAIARTVAEDGAVYGFSQGAIVTLDTRDGSILAMTGGASFAQSQFNRAAQARRQPGSTFKLFSYAAALERGILPETAFSCAPLAGIAGCRSGAGSLDMYRGFALSENAVAVRVGEAAGLENVVALARRLGVSAPLQPDSNAVLGGYEVSMLEMAGAYAAIANGGNYIKPHAVRRILDSRDCTTPKDPATCRVVFDAARDLPARQAISPAVAATLLALMRGVVEYGTGRAAAIPQAVVLGKTGTTDASRDLWFVGLVPSRHLLAAVWLGNDEGTTGGSSAIAAQTWGKFMSQALAP